MKVQILGKGCPKCQKLEENVKKVIEETDKNIRLEKIYDIEEASKMGMMRPPGLAINDEIKSQGRVLSPEEIEDIILE